MIGLGSFHGTRAKLAETQEAEQKAQKIKASAWTPYNLGTSDSEKSAGLGALGSWVWTPLLDAIQKNKYLKHPRFLFL